MNEKRLECRRAEFAHPLHRSERERERKREREREREKKRKRETDIYREKEGGRERGREKEGGRERERKRERERGREREKEREIIVILKGMTGALAPFSYLVLIKAEMHPRYKRSSHGQTLANRTKPGPSLQV